MRRIEVATDMWVVDYEAGIGEEEYDPPMPERQKSGGQIAVNAACCEAQLASEE